MTLAEILPALAEGRVIKRRAWKLRRIDPNRKGPELVFVKDLLADDWEEVE